MHPEEEALNTHNLSWLLLTISIAAEVTGTIALRYSHGLTRLAPSLATGISYFLAIWLMALAVRNLEVGLAYAVWAGAGTALISIIGILWLDESASLPRLIGLLFIVTGVCLLKFNSN